MSARLDLSDFLLHQYSVSIHALSARGGETHSTLVVQSEVDDGDGDDDREVDDEDDGDDDAEASKVSAASERSVRALKNVRVESSESSKQACPICLEVLSGGTEATCMPCSHLYHETCILVWLQKSTSCPLCRYELPP